MKQTRKGKEDKRFKLTDDEVREVHRILMENDQITVKEAAESVDMTSSGLYYRFEILGLKKPRRGRTEERDKEIVRLYGEGKTVKELAKTYGCSKPCIYAVLRRNKMANKQKGRKTDKKAEGSRDGKGTLQPGNGNLVTLELTLPINLYNRIVQIAKATGISTPQLVLRLLTVSMEKI